MHLDRARRHPSATAAGACALHAPCGRSSSSARTAIRSTTAPASSAPLGVDVKASVTGGLVLDATDQSRLRPGRSRSGRRQSDGLRDVLPGEAAVLHRRVARSSTTSAGAARTTSSGFNNSNPNLFYSRRIGRVAVGRASIGDFVDAPRATTILGAAKLTGKTAKGWSIGIIEAVTARERARARDGIRRAIARWSSRLTNYFVGALQREFSRGGVGFLTTVGRCAISTRRC